MKLKVFLVGMMFSSMALAQEGPCAQDMQNLCNGAKGRGMRCLMEHQDKVSDGCRTHMDGIKKNMKATAKDLSQACKEDVASLCKDVKKGQGRVIKCLKEHEEKLSESCKAEIAEKKDNFKMKKEMHGKLMKQHKKMMQNKEAESEESASENK